MQFKRERLGTLSFFFAKRDKACIIDLQFFKEEMNMYNVDPRRLIQMIRQGQNPQQLMLSVLEG